MNTIADRFDQILSFAKSYGLPEQKKRAIVREYIQVKLLDHLYHLSSFDRVYFVGGTSLRLLRNIDRFSEDMDFDISGKNTPLVHSAIDDLTNALHKENIQVELYTNTTLKRSYYELRFAGFMSALGVHAQKEEKLKIKFDFESFWFGHTPETILLNRYGYLAHVVTIPIHQLLVQKLYAYIHRKQTLPRDLYDIVWLISQNARLDHEFMKKNRLDDSIVTEAKKKFLQEKRKIPRLKAKLKPFLIHEQYVDKLSMLDVLLDSLANPTSPARRQAGAQNDYFIP